MTTVNLSGTLPSIDRSSLTKEDNKVYIVQLATLGVSSTMAALPTSADGTSLGRISGTHGTAAPTLQGSQTATTATETARFQFAMPPEYVSGDPIEVRIRGGMLTGAAATSATVDVECYKQDRDGAVGSDLCTTSATNVNTTTIADYDYNITPTGIVAGDVLDIEITAALADNNNDREIEISEIAIKTNIRG